MLRGLFDTLDEASYVESKDALLQLLQTRVWSLLGISPQIHSTIYAWIHFRQFAVTGEPALHDSIKLCTVNYAGKRHQMLHKDTASLVPWLKFPQHVARLVHTWRAA